MNSVILRVIYFLLGERLASIDEELDHAGQAARVHGVGAGEGVDVELVAPDVGMDDVDG